MNNPALLLPGPDGGNPLGFLAALGTLRVAGLVWPEREPRMAWIRHGTGWRPVLHTKMETRPDELVTGLHEYLRERQRAGREGDPDPDVSFRHLTFDRNTTKIEPDRFAELAAEAVKAAPSDPEPAGFLAAIACDGCVTDEGFVEDTALRTMSGQGHQHFLGTMFNLVEKVEPDHVRTSLLEPWRYQDPSKSLSMRWDPNDLKRYALRWDDPSSTSTRTTGSMLGANRLAVEALPLFPTAPVIRRHRPALATTGFDMAREPRWSWPIWTAALTVRTSASLLSHPLLQVLGSPETRPFERDRARQELVHMGVAEVFQSRRVSEGYYRNFTPGRAL